MPIPRPRAEKGRSTIFLLGDLDPPELAFFNAQEIEIESRGERARVEALGHGVAYWAAAVPRDAADVAVIEGQVILQLTAAAYSLLRGVPFAVRIRNWVETRDVVSVRNIVGMHSARFGAIDTLPQDALENTAFRESVTIASTVRQAPLLRIALRDFHAARREPGLDRFLYAYRAVEAVRQLISPDEQDKDRQWAAMHERLGTSRDALTELGNLASLIRHGREDDRRVRAALATPEEQRLLGYAAVALRTEIGMRLGRPLLLLKPETEPDLFTP